MATGVKYKWTKDRCVTQLFRIEKQLVETNVTEPEEAQAAAVQLVVVVIKADALAENQKRKKIMNFAKVMGNASTQAQVAAALSTWIFKFKDQLKV